MKINLIKNQFLAMTYFLTESNGMFSDNDFFLFIQRNTVNIWPNEDFDFIINFIDFICRIDTGIETFLYIFFVCWCKCVWWVMGFYTWRILMIRLLRARHKVNGSIIVYMNSENAYLWRLAVFVIYSTKIMRAIIQMSRVGWRKIIGQ